MRNAKFVVAVGTNGTGKTTYQKQFLKFNQRNLVIPANRADSNRAWKVDLMGNPIPEIPVDGILKKVTGLSPLDWDLLKSPKHREKKHRMLVYMSHIFRAMKGTYKIVINSRNSVLIEAILHDELGFTNGGLFMDDFKNYIPAYNTPAYVSQILSDRRHKSLDIFAATHSPNKIPPLFFDHEPQIVLWKTTRNFSTAKGKIEDELFNQLVEAQKRVNKKPLTRPISPYEVITIPEQ